MAFSSLNDSMKAIFYQLAVGSAAVTHYFGAYSGLVVSRA